MESLLEKKKEANTYLVESYAQPLWPPSWKDKRPQIHLCKSMAMHILMNYYVLTEKPWVKLFECQAEVFGWLNQA